VNLRLASATAVAGFSGITKVVGSASTDTLVGPAALKDQTAWRLTGVDAGEVEGTAFTGFENLTGQNSSSDAFVFESAGSVSGTLDGGTGLLDGFAVLSGGDLTVFQPAGNNAAGSSTVAGKPVTYAGMDHFSPLSGDDLDRVVSGTSTATSWSRTPIPAAPG
jgi:hypothetical protein